MSKIVTHRPTDMEVIQAYKEAELGKEFPDTILMEKFNCPAKVANNAMVRASTKGYINYGVTLRSGWITPKGKEFLKR